MLAFGQCSHNGLGTLLAQNLVVLLRIGCIGVADNSYE
jgi:hypothetical protein